MVSVRDVGRRTRARASAPLGGRPAPSPETSDEDHSRTVRDSYSTPSPGQDHISNPKPSQQAYSPTTTAVTGPTAAATSAVERRIAEAIAEIKKEQTASAERQLMEEITGLIVEETMTKIGYEFYEYFYLLWEPAAAAGRSDNILITEKATPSWGSLVEVKIGDNVVFGTMLRPRSADIEEAVGQAITAIEKYFENYEERQFRTPDMIGTGI